MLGSELDKLLKFINQKQQSFSLKMERVSELNFEEWCEENQVDEDVYDQCLVSGSVWHLIFHPNNRDGFYEYVGATFSAVMEYLLKALESYDEEIN